MRGLTLALSALLAPAAHAADCPSLAERFTAPQLERPMIVAHRGCHAWAPENSVAAIEECVRMGVEAAEIDVRLTGDGALVVFHDSTLARMTDGYGYVFEKTLEELRTLRQYEDSGQPGTYLTHHPIATLDEVLVAADDSLLINLEIKSDARSSFDTVFNAAVAAVREANALDTVFFKIPDNVAGRDRARNPRPRIAGLDLTDVRLHMPIIWYSDIPFTDRLDEFDDYDPVGFEIVLDDIDNWIEGRNDERLDGLRIMMIAVQPRWSAGMSDEVSMVDPQAGWGRLIDLGGDVIMTGRPRALQAYLDRRFGPLQCETADER